MEGNEDERGLYMRFVKVGLPEVDKLLEANGCFLPSCRRRTSPFSEDKNKEDFISKLPDDILLCIIPFLSMREGAATCILSKRWRNLWWESVTSLDFTDINVLGFEHTKDIFEQKNQELPKFHWHLRVKLQDRNVRMRPVRVKGFLQIQRAKYIKQVDKILQLHNASTMDKFVISFPLGRESASHLDIWMKLAAAQGVRKP